MCVSLQGGGSTQTRVSADIIIGTPGNMTNDAVLYVQVSVIVPSGITI